MGAERVGVTRGGGQLCRGQQQGGMGDMAGCFRCRQRQGERGCVFLAGTDVLRCDALPPHLCRLPALGT